MVTTGGLKWHAESHAAAKPYNSVYRLNLPADSRGSGGGRSRCKPVCVLAYTVFTLFMKPPPLLIPVFGYFGSWKTGPAPSFGGSEDQIFEEFSESLNHWRLACS